MSDLKDTHPLFADALEDYIVMSDTFDGERRVKSKTFAYLPPTTGQVNDGALTNTNSVGWRSYQAYLTRAIFPSFVGDAVRTLVGVMHAEEATIELPPELEPMRERATEKGEPLQALLRRINEQQLLFGRYGLLADFPQGPGAERREVPHLVQYEARTISNWDDEGFNLGERDELHFVVLNETELVRDVNNPFNIERQERARALVLVPEDPEDPNSPKVYQTFTEVDGDRSEVITPQFMGRQLDFIPFTFIGSNDLNPNPDEIPLLGLARLSLAIYRGEADYRQSLHLQGQDTLVIIGDEIRPDGQEKDEDEPTEVGAGAVIRVQGEGADAKFIGVNSDGLPEQRQALNADKIRAEQMGAKLLQAPGSQAESGAALQIRVAASTATLSTIAQTGAAGLEHALRQCAVWVGADPEQVKVKPNMDFTQETPSPEVARQLGEALKTGEIPLSRESIHRWLQRKNFTKFSFEEELNLLERARREREESGEPNPGEEPEDQSPQPE